MLFGVLGALLLLAGAFLGWKQNQIATVWPKVEATVIESRIVMKSQTTFGAEITFRYPVGAQERTTTVTPGFETTLREAIQSKIQQFKPGSRHSIRFNPRDPNIVIFNAGYTSDFFTMPLVLSLTGLVLAAIGVAPALLGRTARPAKPGAPANSSDGVAQMVGGTFAVIGTLILAVAFALNVNLLSRQSWPQTEATVSQSRIVSYKTGGTNGNPTRTHYVMKIQFRYHISGREYLAPISAGDGAKSRERLEPILAKFAPGSRHPIHYNPANPKAISFASEGRLWVWIIGAMGTGLLAIGLLCLTLFRTRPAKP